MGTPGKKKTFKLLFRRKGMARSPPGGKGDKRRNNIGGCYVCSTERGQCLGSVKIEKKTSREKKKRAHGVFGKRDSTR